MKDAVRLPAAENPEQWLIAEAAYLSIANYRNNVPHPHEAVEVCDRWQREAEQRGAATDQSYFVIWAAARLRLGEFDAARVDADHAIEAERAGRAWAGGAEALLRAIQAKDKGYRYRCEPPVHDRRCWWPGNE